MPNDNYCNGCIYKGLVETNCGMEFETSDSRKKFCSPKCYNTNRCRVWREREKERRKK